MSRSLRTFLEGAKLVIVAFVASRLIIFAIMMLSRTIMVPTAWSHPGGLLSVLTQWDGELWYIQIARHGYYISSGAHLPHNFWPFYPILIKLTSFVFRDLRVAAIVVSHVCLLLGALCLNALIRLDYKDPRVSRAALVLFLFSPVSFFFSNAYTESTFFALATGAFLAARKGQWLVACLCGMCLSATRQVGILIALPLFLEFLLQFWTRSARLGGWRGLVTPRVLLLGLIPCGIGMHMLYCYIAFGDAFMFSRAARAWGRSFTSPVDTILFLRTYTTFYYILFLSALLVTLAILFSGVLLRIRAT
ncbi:MAG: mannosyltransferase family protein, partial [Chthoniobacterales bacterium]